MVVKNRQQRSGYTSICSGVHMSRSMDLTRLMCVPMPRWIPEQRMQRYTPLRMHIEMSLCAQDTMVNASSQVP